MYSGSTPLARHRIFITGDPVAAAERARPWLCSHSIVGVGERRTFHAGLRAVRLRQVSLGVLEYRCEARLRFAEARDCYLVLVPLRGRARIDTADESLVVSPALGCVLGPHGRVRATWSADCAMLVVRIERDCLETELRERIGDDTVPRFTLALDLGRGLRASWWRLLTHLLTDLDADAALSRHRLCVGGVESCVVRGLLAAQPHCHSRRWHDRPAAGGPAILRVLDLLEQRPQLPWRVPRLAREAGIGVRALYVGFRRELDTTPMAHLRKIRLRRVHRDLRHARPGGGVTVTAVATSWGFNHLGEFAAAYRRFYDENPSVTLRRAVDTWDDDRHSQPRR